VFSTRSVPRCYKQGHLVRGLLRFSRCELVAEARESSGTQRNGNVRRLKPLPSNGSEDVTENTSLCVIVNCKVLSRAVSMSSINPITNPNPVYRNQKGDNIFTLLLYFRDYPTLCFCGININLTFRHVYTDFK
jgi:hypothetical protein